MASKKSKKKGDGMGTLAAVVAVAVGGVVGWLVFSPSKSESA